MKVQSMKLSDLTPYEGNPRNNEQAINKVAESIRQFGPRQPIVVDTKRVIIVGHTRYYAALKLGLDSFPVHVAKDLTPGQAALYRIADNRTAECATWDLDKLRGELEAIAGMADNSDIVALGICVADWPELAVPDFEDLATDGDKAAGVRSNLLAIGKYRIALTDAEEAAFVATVMQYSEESGTLFGFGRWLLTKAGITVKEEVSHGEGSIATLI